MTEIQKLEKEIMGLNEKLGKLRKDSVAKEIKNYTFKTEMGETSLLDLFGKHDRLMVIHNMGQGCRYCTLWADGFNGFVPHLETAMSVVLASKDDPATQRLFANSRNWRFKMVSHGGGSYMTEQSAGEGNQPGVVVYEKQGNKILRKNASGFGPGDQFCSAWDLLSLAGMNPENWTPQYNYWKAPKKLDDGGENVSSDS